MGESVIWVAKIKEEGSVTRRRSVPHIDFTQYINNQTDGLGSFIYADMGGPANYSTVEAYGTPLNDTTGGAGVVALSIYGPSVAGCLNDMCESWDYCFTPGDTGIPECNPPGPLDEDLDMSHFTLRTTTPGDLPIWAHSCHHHLCVAVNSAKDGTGDWNFTEIFDAGLGDSHAFMSFEVLSGGNGYAMYYRYANSVDVNTTWYDWEVARTASPTGDSGWTTTTLHTLFNDGGVRAGVLGIDGDGYPYIAHSLGNYSGGSAEVQIRVSTDLGANNWTEAEVLEFPLTCIHVYVDYDRAVILTDGTPAFIAACQEGTIYLVKADSASASGTWSITEEVTGVYIGGTPHATMSIALSGNGFPHISYLIRTGTTPEPTWAVHYLQSLIGTGF